MGQRWRKLSRSLPEWPLGSRSRQQEAQNSKMEREKHRPRAKLRKLSKQQPKPPRSGGHEKRLVMLPNVLLASVCERRTSMTKQLGRNWKKKRLCSNGICQASASASAFSLNDSS